MRSQVVTLANEYEWHRWWAWHPIRVRAGNSRMHCWVWRELVERKYIGHYDGTSVIYRLISK